MSPRKKPEGVVLGFDASGQPLDAAQGEPKDLEQAAAEVGVEAVTAPPEIPEDESPPEPVPVAEAAEGEAAVRTTDVTDPSSPLPIRPPDPDDLRSQLLELMKDPEVAAETMRIAMETPEGRKLLSTLPAVPQVREFLEYKRNYKAEAALRVYGGTEVAHPDGFEPLPPGYIPRYEKIDGGTTDHADQAALAQNGKPQKTRMYRWWLDKQMKGEHMDGAVRSDISAGIFKGDTEEGELVTQANDPGVLQG